MSVVVEQQTKECIRVALQELGHPTCKMSTCEAMRTLHTTVSCSFRHDHGAHGCVGVGDFAGDDDFKEEIFSARVVQVVMDVSRDKEKYPWLFYQLASNILSLLCCENAELANAFVANGGVEFLLEYLETFSSDEFLLMTCFAIYKGIIESLDTNESVAFAGMTLEKLVDVF
jgi:hypothetical protein